MTHWFDLANIEWVKKMALSQKHLQLAELSLHHIKRKMQMFNCEKKELYYVFSMHSFALSSSLLSLLPTIVCLLNEPQLKLHRFIYMSLHLIPETFLISSSYSSLPLRHSFLTTLSFFFTLVFFQYLIFFRRYMLANYLYAIFVLPFLRHGSDDLPSSVTTIGSTFGLL